jgi:hypothetical protein
LENAPTASDIHWISWLLGLTTSFALILVGWGFKDIKKRFDAIPGMESDIKLLKVDVARLLERTEHGGKSGSHND